MSIKIWEAVRLPTRQLSEYITLCNDATWKYYFNNTLGWHLASIDWKKIKQDAKGKDYYSGLDDEDVVLLERRLAVEELVKKYREASIRPYKDELLHYNVNAGLNVWIDKRFSYVIPINAVLVNASYTVDYHYQNQTDRPKGITCQQYTARRIKWDSLCLDDWDKTRLYHPIIDFEPTAYRSIFEVELYLGLHRQVPGCNKRTFKTNEDLLRWLIEGRK